MIYLYKFCFLPLLPAFVMKCVLMHCSMPHHPYCCLLPSSMCLLYLLICTCINSSPNACPPSSVLHWCLLCMYYKTIVLCQFGMYIIFCLLQVFLKCFKDPIRVPRIENRVPRIRENYHRVPGIWEIGSLNLHIGYLTFSLKKTGLLQHFLYLLIVIRKTK